MRSFEDKPLLRGGLKGLILLLGYVFLLVVGILLSINDDIISFIAFAVNVAVFIFVYFNSKEYGIRKAWAVLSFFLGFLILPFYLAKLENRKKQLQASA